MKLRGDAGLRNRADAVALRMIELTLAFGALLGVNDIGLVLERDRGIRAFEFASTADGALGSDDLVGHALFSSQQIPSRQGRVPTGK